MTNMLNAILVIVLMLNLFALGTSRIVSVIRTVAIQGSLLGLIPLLVHHRPTLPIALASCAAVVLKGMLIPAMMVRALRESKIKREVEPLVGLLPSIILGALGGHGANDGENPAGAQRKQVQHQNNHENGIQYVGHTCHLTSRINPNPQKSSAPTSR